MYNSYITFYSMTLLKGLLWSLGVNAMLIHRPGITVRVDVKTAEALGAKYVLNQLGRFCNEDRVKSKNCQSILSCQNTDISRLQRCVEHPHRMAVSESQWPKPLTVFCSFVSPGSSPGHKMAAAATDTASSAGDLSHPQVTLFTF